MPRRQLRSVDPRIDLTGFLLAPPEIPKEISSTVLFGNVHPLELEIGSGKGLFLQNAAGLRPEHNFVGIEIAHQYAKAAAARLARADRRNARMIAGDARELVAQTLPLGSLAAVHVYFPDPWWKRKHKKRRVLNEVFLRQLYGALAPAGRLHFWTDVLEYFEATLELIGEQVPELGVPIPDEPLEDDREGRTHFDRRSLRFSIPVYRVYFQRSAQTG